MSPAAAARSNSASGVGSFKRRARISDWRNADMASTQDGGTGLTSVLCAEAKTARFIDDEERVAPRAQTLDPGHELLGPKPSRGLRRGMIVLRRDDVKLLVDVHSELDRRGLVLNLLTGSRECGRPFVMNDCFKHTVAAELPPSPAPFHAIYHDTSSRNCSDFSGPAGRSAPVHGSRRRDFLYFRAADFVLFSPWPAVISA